MALSPAQERMLNLITELQFHSGLIDQLIVPTFRSHGTKVVAMTYRKKTERFTVSNPDAVTADLQRLPDKRTVTPAAYAVGGQA